MRTLIKLCCVGMLLLGLSKQADAKCSWWYLQTLPEKGAKKVPLNVKPFFAVYGYKRDLAIKMLENSVLFGEGHKVGVKVNVLPSSKGSLQMTYVVLEPASPLKPNRKYRLDVPKSMGKSKKDYGIEMIYNSIAGYQFTTGTKSDVKAPAAITQVQSKGYRYARLGCGPVRNIRIKVKGLSDNATPTKHLRFAYKVTWNKGKKTKKFVVYGSTSWGGELSLGHGMCSGNFAGIEVGTYTIRVQAIDFAGNKTPWSKPVVASVPFRKIKRRY